MRHDERWYAKLAHDLGHDGSVTLAEVRQQEARDCRQLADRAKWVRRGASYHLDLDGNYYVIGHEPGRRTWQIQAWPADRPGSRIIRTQGGIGTLAEAKSLALAMPCARCGLANHLALMIQRLPARPSLRDLVTERWRCADAQACEAERTRLTTGSDPLIEIAVLVRHQQLTDLSGLPSSHQGSRAATFTLHNTVTGESAPVTIDPADPAFQPICRNSLIENL